MLTLHGFWSAGRGLCLWAEDSARAVKSRSQAVRTARRHPFAAPAEELTGIGAGVPGAAVLLLPSLLTAPLDSPELVRATPRPTPRSAPTLAPWSVPVVVVPPAEVLATLESVDGEARSGPSLEFLRRVGDLARDLVDRGRVLPSVADEDDGIAARWRPVLQGPDLVAADALGAATPPVARAERRHDDDTRGQDPRALLGHTLEALVDAAARERLAAEPAPLLPARRGRAPARPPAAERWLLGLLGSEPGVDLDPADQDMLRRALGGWDVVGAPHGGPARATFRLRDVVPDQLDEARAEVLGDDLEEPRWRLDFLLQSADDPSLLVEAEQVWSSGGALGRWLDEPEELLLGELGRAARIYPELAEALRRPRPTGHDLDAEGTYHFLSAVAAVLDQAGFGVLLPTWWHDHRGLGLALTASPTGVDGVVEKESRFGREQLMDFHWQLAVGDEVLTEEEMAALAETKAPLVRLRGRWVAVDPERLRRGLDWLRRAGERRGTAGEVLQLAATHHEDLDTPLPVSSVRADGWLGDLLAGAAEHTLTPVPTPDGFTADLRPYQQRGLAWLAFLSSLGLGGVLADDMGLGKTIQLLALEAADRADTTDAADRANGTDGADRGPTLLVCPTSVLGNWEREAARFAPELAVALHHGAGRARGEGLTDLLRSTDVLATTYGTLLRDVDELAEHPFRRVVLDEAQVVKNSLSRGARAVRRLQAEHRVALTGTPVENRLAELWSVMDFLNPGMLGNSESFRARYAVPVERHGRADVAENLKAVTRPYVLRRVKTDPTIIDDLPEKIEMKTYCRLSTEQASLYQTVVDDMMEKIEDSDGIERRGNVLAALTKLKQVCDHPALLLHDGSAIGHRSGKVERLEEILAELLDEGDRALLFTQFTQYAEMLLPHLATRFGTDVAYLHGGTPRARRDEMVARFQSSEGPPLFLLSLKAGGTGLNLTAANHVVHLDRWWNPAVENQATDRAFRIGQRRSVQVRKFVCVGTLEERIDEMIEEKKALADMVVGDGEGWLTELSTSALRDMFALGAGAVDE